MSLSESEALALSQANLADMFVSIRYAVYS